MEESPDEEEKVLENLVNITSFCPDDILSGARKRGDLNQLLCDDPIANEFMKLDSEIYIDKDDKDVKKFGDAVFDLVTSLCDLIRYKHNDLNFTVIPGGSFPLNVKVENLDEFDYVLDWKNKAGIAVVQKRKYSHKIFQVEELLPKLLDVIKKVLIKSAQKSLSDIQLIQQQHAVNIKFSWLCTSNQKHSVSIDLAISIKTSSTIQGYFSEFPLKGTPFEDSINVNEKMYWSCSLIGGYGRPDTNIFSKQILETCDEISPNIRLCYRVLKFIRDYYLLYFVRKNFCHLGRYDLHYFKTGVSSYSLKQALLLEVIEFPLSDHWKNDFIHLRIASMLQKHLEGYNYIFEKSTKIRVSGAFSPLLANMIMWLRSGCKRNSLPPRRVPSVRNKDLTVLSENNILVSLNKETLFNMHACGFLVTIIMFNSFKPLVLHNKILVGLSEAFNGVVESMDHVDLSSFNGEDAGIIFCLLRFFMITKNEIDNNNYSNKLSSFKKMLVMYRIPCFHVYKNLKQLERYCFSEDYFSTDKTLKENELYFAFTSLEKIFTTITWEERSYIYRCLTGYTRKVSETMAQSLDKVEDVFKDLRSWCVVFKEELWTYLSVKNLK